jgi:tRNA/tmRNA/rRNA uracil-C5-methylase (TrmA/RlmC/RlmD family)
MHELGEGKSPYHDRDSIFVWRAKFTLEHYQDKKFTGGFFQQHDAKYPRSCLTLDYTPETFSEVLDRFCAWMDRAYDTDHVTINKMTVRTFPERRLNHAVLHLHRERDHRVAQKQTGVRATRHARPLYTLGLR